jgi:hypothetical protein
MSPSPTRFQIGGSVKSTQHSSVHFISCHGSGVPLLSGAEGAEWGWVDFEVYVHARGAISDSVLKPPNYLSSELGGGAGFFLEARRLRISA